MVSPVLQSIVVPPVLTVKVAVSPEQMIVSPLTVAPGNGKTVRLVVIILSQPCALIKVSI